MNSRRDRGLTAVELIVVIVVIGIGAAVTVPALLRSGRNDLMARCESNLRGLWNADANRRAKGGAAPAARGRAYWEAVSGDGKDLLTCPLPGHAPYRGPATDPGSLHPLDLMGADAPGSHGPGEGGNFLLKNGDVRACRERDPVWKLAAERLAP